MDHVRDVIPSINTTHASTVVNNWTNVTLLEYMTWMALLMTMTVVVYVDKRTYWHMGSSMFFPKINFSDYVSYERVILIIQYHMFELYDAEKHNADPLYQIRCFLAAFNE